MLTRREFVWTGVTAALSGGQGTSPQTAGQVLDRIRAGIGVPWRESTVDGIKAGRPETVVTGIGTTAMATLEVLRHAADSRRNLIVTQEPVFYSGNDAPGNRSTDPVYLAKKAFIDERGLVVLRLTDHWNARVPNENVRALADALGWGGYRDVSRDGIYTLPRTTVRDVSLHLEKRLGARGLRTVGRTDLGVTTVFLSPGTTDLASTVRNVPRVDVVIAGEPREWEAVPYVLDTAETGSPKALIALGRVVSETPGAKACAAWLETLVPGMSVGAIPVADPYWRPAA